MAGKRKSNKIAGKVVDAIASGNGQSVARLVTDQLGYRPVQLAEKIATPEQARAIRAHLVRRIVAQSVPAAITLLEQEVALGLKRQERKEGAGTGALDAAKHLTNLGGLQAIAEEKDIAEMSDHELKQLVEQASGEAARRSAVDVDGSVSAPSDAPADGQAIEETDILFS